MWGREKRVFAKSGAATVLACAALFALGILGWAETAQGQIVCEPGTIEVSTAAELNAAIECVDVAGSVDIVLLNDIEAESLAGDSVFATIDGGGYLIIDGGGFTIRRGASAPTTPGPVLALIDDGPPGFTSLTELTLVDLGIEVGPADTAGIQHEGRHELQLQSVSIVAGPSGSAATGIVNRSADGGQVTMVESLIDGVPVGVEASGSFFFIQSSSIRSTGIDVDAVRPVVSGISNSTLAGPVGIRLTSRGFRVQNSTIIGDGAALSASATADSYVAFQSSIVNTCSADEFLTDTQPGPGWGDLGNNAGGCFDPSPALVVPLSSARDNGCVRATPAGCPLTAAIDEFSPARSVGLCEDAVAADGIVDQRGVPRTPTGLGCDAGAYEYGCGGSGGDFDVSTAAEFNRAIACLNLIRGDGAQPTVAMTLLNDIEADATADSSVFTRIDQPQRALLTIDGDGHSVRRTAAAPTTPLPLLASTASTMANVDISDLGINVGPNDTFGIELLGGAELEIRNSSIVASVRDSPATGILSDATDTTTVVDSVIQGMRIGLQASGENVGTRGTTVTSSEVDLVDSGSIIFSAVNSTLTAPVGMQFDDTGFHFLAYSTVLGDGAATTATSTGVVTAISSIVGSCSVPVSDATNPGPGIVDGGGNVGGCFNPGQITDTELADNGCQQTTPVGCPLTIALDTDSPALGAGDCSETNGGLVDVDQRNEPRTPVGPGCDAGAYEAPCTTSNHDVGTIGALNAAIGCFNSASAQPGTHTISLMNDLVLLSRLESINQPGDGLDLVIDGAGNRILHPEPLGISAGPGTTWGMVTMHEANRSPVEIRNIILETERDPDVDHLVWNASSAAVSVHQSTLYLLESSAINSSGGADLTIETSSVSAGSFVVRANGGDLTIDQSTIVDLAENGFGVEHGGAGTIDVLNSTFIGGGVFTSAGATGTVSNSTIAGLANAGTSPLSFESSIVESCGPTTLDGGNNAGGCFGAAVDLGSAADNGCEEQTPTGCPLTYALSSDSPAHEAGDCSGVGVDQRGVPRTPVGAGCDAGAYEIVTLPGDVTADGTVDNADVQSLLGWLAGGNAPVGLAAGDVTNNGTVNLADALAIAQQLAAG